jgi:2-polyprenyl-3-methyl-5-hydroxy-6-metoxy-1,4-benzoquinol methylase
MDMLAIQKEYYDRRWAQEKFVNSLQASRCAAILGAIARLDFIQPRILDLGCGSGWLTAILGHFGPTTGVDLSDHVVKEACKLYPWVQFYAANILQWEEASQLGQFDIVVSQEVIEHVPDKSKYLRIAYDFLKEGGALIITTPNARTFAAMPDELRQSWSDQPLEDLLTTQDLEQMVRGLFDIVEARTIISGGSKGLYRIVNSYKLRMVLENLGLYHIFEAACLRVGFGLHTFAVARKSLTKNCSVKLSNE